MKKRILSILLTLCMALCLIPTAVFAEGSTAPADITGSGASDDPYLIYTAAGLKAFRDKVNGQNWLTKQPGAHAKLMNDIVLNDGTFDADGNYTPGASGKDAEKWTPIGYFKDDSDRSRYAGTFDGDGHTVKGLYVKDVEYAGLFGYAMNATIKNVTVDGYITTEHYSGGIAGYLSGGSVTSCFNYCTLNSKSTSGGIAGFIAEQCKITGCGNAGSVSGTNIGGVVGYAKGKCVIQNCYNVGAVSTYSCAGGIAGDSFSSSIIACYNTGTVIVSENAYDNAYVGGIIGNAFNSGSIYFCYWLKGTARNAAGYDPEGTMLDPEKTVLAPDAKTKEEFADGTVLALLKNGETLPGFGKCDFPWEKCGYLSAAGMIVPLLKGQTSDTFPIYTAEDLKAFCDMVNSGESGAHALLMADVDLGGEPWTPIANYTGTFDGNGKTISGLNVTGVTNAGLFGTLSGRAVVKNLTVAGSIEASGTNGSAYAGGITAKISDSARIMDCVNNATVKATVNNDVDARYVAYAGGMAGHATGSAKITGCKNNGTLATDSVLANAFTGGMAGFTTENVTIENCLNTAALSAIASASRYLSDGVTEYDYIEAVAFAGGMAGRVEGGTITGCYNTDTVTASGTGSFPQQSNAGGMVGSASSIQHFTVTITNCGSTGKITASCNGKESIAGGIVGSAQSSIGISFTISHCYSTGDIASDGSFFRIGGIVGNATGTALTISDCYYLMGICDNAVGSNDVNHTASVTRTAAHSRSDFADGTVLTLLQNGNTGVWTKTGYLPAARLTLPLLDWQTASSHTHSYERKYNDTQHWRACYCGAIEAGSTAAHSGTDDGDCTTEVVCDACRYVITAAKSSHDWSDWAPASNDMHGHHCQSTDCHATETESCSGGTATCTAKAKCSVCDEEYGAVDPDNHTDTTEWIQTETKHTQKYKFCGTVTVAEEAHEWENGVCAECHYACTHTGGTATCKDKAVCEVCGESYGELDSNNHANMKHIEANAATKNAEGNIEYWYCPDCGKYYKDAAATQEITKADTVTAKLPEEKPISPKTGDTSNLALWIALLFISGGVVTATTIVSKKKQHSKE